MEAGRRAAALSCAEDGGKPSYVLLAGYQSSSGHAESLGVCYTEQREIYPPGKKEKTKPKSVMCGRLMYGRQRYAEVSHSNLISISLSSNVPLKLCMCASAERVHTRKLCTYFKHVIPNTDEFR